MLLENLSRYLIEVQAALHSLKDCHFEKYQEEIFAAQRINLRVRVRFSNGSLLEINEAVAGDEDEVNHLNYRYHLQDKDNKVIFRYDNTPHFPDLDTFPHHKHTAVNVIAADKPTIVELIEEVKEHLAPSSI